MNAGNRNSSSIPSLFNSNGCCRTRVEYLKSFSVTSMPPTDEQVRLARGFQALSSTSTLQVSAKSNGGRLNSSNPSDVRICGSLRRLQDRKWRSPRIQTVHALQSWPATESRPLSWRSTQVDLRFNQVHLEGKSHRTKSAGLCSSQTVSGSLKSHGRKLS
jgi:hypothetical protein